jgi:hypothetical protein
MTRAEDNTGAPAKETAATDGTNKNEGQQVQESPTKIKSPPRGVEPVHQKL